MAVMLAFSLIPLLALGWIINNEYGTAYRSKVTARLSSAVAGKRRVIDLFLAERVAQLKNLALTHSYAEISDPKQLRALFNTIQGNSKSYIDVGIIDSSGQHVAYVGPYRLGAVNYSEEPWFQEAMLRGEHVSDVFMGFRNFPHFIIAVRNGQGESAWILRATIDSDIFNQLVQSLQLGDNGDAFLVNSQGKLQTTPRRGQGLLSACPVPIPARFEGERVQETAIQAKDMICGQTWLEGKDWLLVVLEDPDEAFSPLFQARYTGALALGAAALVLITGVALTSRTMVTRLVRAEQEKAALDANLMQSGKMAALGKLAAGVAHEVNNPLTLIMESAGWIKDLLTEEDPAQIVNYDEISESLDKIELNVERARGVTHRMLGFARRMEPMEEDVDLNLVAEHTMGFLANEALHREIGLSRDFSERLPRVTTDSAQLQQVLLNLIENAIDAVGNKGQVVVRTRFKPDDRVVTVAVADTGPGIAPDVLPRIFDPFFSSKKPGEGTGLGLSIAYSIMQKLGGSLDVESALGQGTTFTVSLPVSGGRTPRKEES